MIAVEYCFECVKKSKGRCMETGTAGCDLDCEKLRCDYCIRSGQDKNKPPCVGCMMVATGSLPWKG